MNRGIIIALLLYVLHPVAICQGGTAAPRDMTVDEYIKKFAPIASEEMKKSGIPASITLAQGILESSNGNSELAKNANNHFGIKCHKDWTGKGYLKDDETKKECFRVYETPEESFIDHVNFLKNRSNYSSLFQLSPTDYKGWAKGLKAAGYATNPDYPALLIKIIEDHNLYNYDTGEKSLETAKAPANLKEATQQYSDKVVMFNDIKTVIAQPGETLNDIATKFKVSEKSLIDYNDISGDDTVLTAGSRVYLNAKRFMGVNKTHEVKKGENMRSISQEEGVKLWWLYHKNRMEWGEEPAVGETLCLKFACNVKPKLKTDEDIQQEIADGIAAHENELRAQYAKQRADSLAKLKPAATSEQDEPVTNGMPKIAGDPDGKAPAPAQNNTYFANSIHTVGDTMPMKIHDDGLSMNLIVNQDDKTPSRNYHLVKAHETLFSIAQMYYTRVDSLQKWNSLAGPIHEGQDLIVGFGNIPEPKTPQIINPEVSTPATQISAPATWAPSPPAQTSSPSTNATSTYHIVTAGEGLYGIARQYKVTTDQLRQWNNLQSDNLSIGQKLIVSAGIPASIGKGKNTSSAVRHQVAAHETLSAIARQYGVTIRQLKDWNKLSSDSVKIGQSLIVGQ